MNDKNAMNSDFNFLGSCKTQKHQIKIYMSVSADEMVHRLKVEINPHLSKSDEKELQVLNQFKEQAENKNIHDVDEFFIQSGNEFPALYYAFQRGLLSYLGDLSLIQKKIKTGKILCSCTGLTEEEWKGFLQQKKLTIDTIIKSTKIATGCGSCRADLKLLLKSYEDFPNLTSRSYLKLWDSMSIKKAEYLCRCKKVTLNEVADFFESYSLQSSKNILAELQTKWKIGLSCHACINDLLSYIKSDEK